MHPIDDGFVARYNFCKAWIGLGRFFITGLSTRTMIVCIVLCRYIKIRSTRSTRITECIFDVWKVRGAVCFGCVVKKIQNTKRNESVTRSPQSYHSPKTRHGNDHFIPIRTILGMVPNPIRWCVFSPSYSYHCHWIQNSQSDHPVRHDVHSDERNYRHRSWH
jgi:hypothetical protein